MKGFINTIKMHNDRNKEPFLVNTFCHYVKGILTIELEIHRFENYRENIKNIVHQLDNNPSLTSQYISKLFVQEEEFKYIDLDYNSTFLEKQYIMSIIYNKDDKSILTVLVKNDYLNIKEGLYKIRVTIPHEYKTADNIQSLPVITHKQKIGNNEFTLKINPEIYYDEEKAAKIRKHDEIMKEKIVKYKEYNESQKEIKKQKRLAKKAKNRHIPKRLKQKKKRDKMNTKKEGK